MTHVVDIMAKDVVFVEDHDPVTKAQSILRETGYHALPVCKDGRVVGIVSRGDALRVTSRKSNVEVKGIMSRNLVTSDASHDIFEAARRLVKAGVRQLPVVDDRKLIGILSLSDILGVLVAENHIPREKKIGDIMNKNVVVCDLDEEISGIWNMMEKSGYSGFPVVKKGKVVGMITRMDIIKRRSLNLLKESGKSKHAHIKKAITSPAATISPEKRVEEAAKMMVDRKIIRLPVTDGKGSLLGIVDGEDVLRAYLP